MPPGLISEVKAWAAANSTTRSDAFRRLVEIGLTVKSRLKQASRARADQANAMAGKQLDELVDVSASAKEQASRKRRLLRLTIGLGLVRNDLAGLSRVCQKFVLGSFTNSFARKRGFVRPRITAG